MFIGGETAGYSPYIERQNCKTNKVNEKIK